MFLKNKHWGRKQRQNTAIIPSAEAAKLSPRFPTAAHKVRHFKGFQV